MFRSIWRKLGRPALCAAALATGASLAQAQLTIPQPAGPLSPLPPLSQPANGPLSIPLSQPANAAPLTIPQPDGGQSLPLSQPANSPLSVPANRPLNIPVSQPAYTGPLSIPNNQPASAVSPITPVTIIPTTPSAPVAAPTPPASYEDKARIERLEKELQDLKQLLQARPLQAPIATEAPANSLGVKDVQQLINTYMAEKEAEKKAATKAAPKSDWYQVGSDPSFSSKSGWAGNRITWESPEKDFKAHLGGRMQFDNTWIGAASTWKKAIPASGSFDDGNFFRRLRVEFDGQAYENFEWNMELDLERNALFEKNQKGDVVSNGNFPAMRFDELYIGLRNIPIIGNVRVGNVRPPMGLECYTSSRNLLFMERSSGFEAFLQEFAPGVWAFNDYNKRVFWAATVDRPNFSVQKAGEYGDGDIAFTGRIAALPIFENEGRCLVHVGASYQYRANQFNGNFGQRSTSFSAPPDWRATYFTPNLVTTGTFISDHSNMVGLEFLSIMGPFRLQAEYFGVQASDVTFPASVKNGNGPRNFNSGYVAASYFLTGEHTGYDTRLGRVDRLRPNEHFYFVRGENGLDWGRGAWEVAARWDWIDLDSKDIHGGYMNNYTLGLNWYWNPNIKWQFNYTATDRTLIGGPLGAGASGHTPLLHALGIRVQWEF